MNIAIGIIMDKLKTGISRYHALALSFVLMISFLPAESSVNDDLGKLRSLYNFASENKTKAKELLTIAESRSVTNTLYQGYLGAGKILMANHATYPLQKWNLFKEGKNILEAAISTDRTNVELRYLRLTIQTNVPEFLGYSSNIDQDKKFLKSEIEQIADKELKQIINNYFIHLKK